MEKADLSKGYQNPKRKLGVTTHFSEIIGLKFGKKIAIHSLYVNTFFLELWLLNYLYKMHGYPHFSFWISITLKFAKICFSPTVITFVK